MEAILNDFFGRIKERSHLRPLLWRSLHIFIECEDQVFKRSVALHKLEVSEDSEIPSLKISGNMQHLALLLSGEVPLRKLMLNYGLKVSGSHKEILRLESLCLLCSAGK